MNDNIFATRDLVLASFLRYNHVELVDGYDKDTKSWHFADIEKCNELSLQLRNGSAMVEVLQYESIRRNLLGMVHDRKN